MMSQIQASSLSGLRPVQPGQIISANLINLLIDAHVQLERRLRALEQREPERPPQGGGGGPKPGDTGVVVPPVFVDERPHIIGPAIDFAEIIDTNDGPMAVITGKNLHEFDSVKLGEIAVDTSKAVLTEDGMRIPLKGQTEVVRAMQDSGSISSVSISGREGMAAKSVQFGQLGRGGRIK